MSLNRVVVLLTPIFAGLAGWFCQWAAEHLPGAPNLDQDGLTAVFIAGVVSALAAAVKWLDGWQKAEAEGRVR